MREGPGIGRALRVAGHTLARRRDRCESTSLSPGTSLAGPPVDPRFGFDVLRPGAARLGTTLPARRWACSRRAMNEGER